MRRFCASGRDELCGPFDLNRLKGALYDGTTYDPDGEPVAMYPRRLWLSTRWFLCGGPRAGQHRSWCRAAILLRGQRPAT